ncbi:MAG: hypothetical protein ACRD26_04235 [Vicinamibacterales bacterium]
MNRHRMFGVAAGALAISCLPIGSASGQSAPGEYGRASLSRAVDIELRVAAQV